MAVEQWNKKGEGHTSTHMIPHILPILPPQPTMFSRISISIRVNKGYDSKSESAKETIGFRVRAGGSFQ